MGSFNVGDWMTTLGQAFAWLTSVVISIASTASSH